MRGINAGYWSTGGNADCISGTIPREGRMTSSPIDGEGHQLYRWVGTANRPTKKGEKLGLGKKGGGGKRTLRELTQKENHKLYLTA